MAERTLIIVKPDGLQRRLAGEIISRFEKKGLKLVAAKLMRLSLSLAQKHYEIHRGKDFFDRAVDYISSGPVLAVVLEGPKVIEITRKMMGATFGFNADAGTIRGDYSMAYLNIVHGSDSVESAQREIPLYFTPDEILDYQMPDEKWM
ncbi:MAG TPA: nucleoside-diphosphate kinase [Phycisphaerales bacterium]|nr:MAG: nucleoside-diphosphate kinase [Planctomycetes bacterium GWC2_45_44]HBG77964.1 nucleoside-diphosphate kinase [Phycisphaerales bacterium]HBR18635.1 nucleoside-diphosphate kinase [Phycisphaerales bacterium]